MVKRVFSYIQRTEVIQSASILVFGTLIAQSIPILLQPFLRRYFSPEDFGYYSVYVSIIGILLVVSSMRYEQTIVLPKSDSDAIQLVNISMFISLIFSILILFIVLIFHSKFLQVLNIPYDKGFIIYLVPLGTFLLSIFQVLNFWLIRKKRFKSISINKLSRRFVEGGTQSFFAFTKFSNGLVIGDIAGQLANSIVSFYQSFKSGYRLELPSSLKAKRLLREYIMFPKISLIPAVMSAICYMMPVVFINKYYSAEQAGYFDLTKLILSVPLALIASSFSSVVLNKTSECYRNDKPFLNEILPLIWIVVAISILEILLILFWSEFIFTFVFGEKWLPSGAMAKYLVFPFALNFITSSFTSIFIAINKIAWQSVWQLFYFIMIFSLPFLAGLSFQNFIVVYTAIEIVANVAMIVLLIMVIRNVKAATS
jgi:O-antigen/teichoic acid export membrane protein